MKLSKGNKKLFEKIMLKEAILKKNRDQSSSDECTKRNKKVDKILILFGILVVIDLLGQFVRYKIEVCQIEKRYQAFVEQIEEELKSMQISFLEENRMTEN